MGKKEKSEKRKSTSVADEADLSMADTSLVGDSTTKNGSYDASIQYLSSIAQPLAGRKLVKKLYKITKKAQGAKSIRKGVKEVQKFIRKGERGIVIFAGNTNPIDVICHMPVVCEEKDIPYCYAPSKEDIGLACGSKRPTCMVMVKQHDDYKDLYTELHEELQQLPQPIS